MHKALPASLLGLLLLACQPAAPLLLPTLQENGTPLHQGGVVFLGIVQAAANPRVQLVTLDGKVVNGTVQAGGRFQLTHVPEGERGAIAALRVEADGHVGYVEHESGGGVTRHWVRHDLDHTYDVGALRFADGHFSSEHNLLAELDTDKDGQSDMVDLDDDNDGMPDREDRDDAGHGLPDDHDPLLQ